MNKKTNINTLFMKYILGEANDAERSEIQERADKDEISSILNSSDLAERYAIYDSIKIPDVHLAYQKLTAKPRYYRLIPWAIKSAAAVLLLLVSMGAYWYSIQPVVTPPHLSDEVTPFIAMQENNSDISSHLQGEVRKGIFEAQKTAVTQEQIAPYQLDPATAESMLRAENISTTSNKEYWLTLDDGTIVHLASGSRIIYPEHFARPTLWNTNPVREVVLEGDAYFMVAHDTKRTFVVHTLHGDIIDYGTEFFVSTKDKTTKVALVEGSVGVKPHGFSETRLKPGQETVINSNNITVTVADMEQYTAWNTGKLAFSNMPLEHVMEVMSKWYGIKVRYADEKVKHLRLSGYFDRYKQVSDAIDAIVAVTGLTVEIADDGTYIYKEAPVFGASTPKI